MVRGIIWFFGMNDMRFSQINSDEGKIPPGMLEGGEERRGEERRGDGKILFYWDST